jgi:hypothetical protein
LSSETNIQAQTEELDVFSANHVRNKSTFNHCPSFEEISYHPSTNDSRIIEHFVLNGIGLFLFKIETISSSLDSLKQFNF